MVRGGTKRLEAAVSALYKLPPSDFVGARNALAEQCKLAGDTASASEVRALQRPLASAWVANQLYWRSTRRFQRLIDAGERLREVQQASLGGRAGEQLRRAGAERRKCIDNLLGQAEKILVESGQSAGKDITRRIEMTLEAIASYGNAGPQQELGRLTRDVEPPGFETLLAAKPTSRAKPDRGVDRAREKLGKAEQRAAIRRAEAERAAQACKAARKHVEQAQREEQDASRLLEEARKAVRVASSALRRAGKHARTTAEALTRAEQAVETTRKELEGRRP